MRSTIFIAVIGIALLSSATLFAQNDLLSSTYSVESIVLGIYSLVIGTTFIAPTIYLVLYTPSFVTDPQN